MKKHVQTDSEWQEEMSQKIIYEAGALGSFTEG